MIRFNNNDDGHTIAAAAKCSFFPGRDPVIANVGRDGVLRGGVIFQDYTGASILVHVAGFAPGWLSNDMLWAAFHYPFEQLGCSKLLGALPASNSKALEFDRKLGFNFETRVADVYPDGDMVVLSMYKADCRWLKLKPRGLVSNGR